MKMKKTKLLLKKMFAVLLVAAMTITLIPSESYAYLGAIREGAAEHAGTVTKKNGDVYAYLENDYIYFEICIKQKTITYNDIINHNYRTGRVAHTVPKAALKDKTADLDSFGTQIMHYQVCDVVGNNEVIKNDYSEVWPTTLQQLDESIPIVSEEYGNISFLLKDSEGREFNVNFMLQRVDTGNTEADSMPDYLPADPNDLTNNWGVHMECQNLRLLEKGEEAVPDKYWSGCYTWQRRYEVGRVDLEYKDFPKMGHSNTDASIPTVKAQMDQGGKLKNVIINAGIDATKNNQVKEVFCDSYDIAAPFVAISHDYRNYEGSGLQNPYGIQGHGFHYPVAISYSKCSLHTYTEQQMAMDNGGMGFWGFRNLKTVEEMAALQSSPEATDPDKVTVSSDSQFLYVKKQGSGYKVYTAATQDKVPSDSVAVYRGKYNIYDSSYKFVDKAVELSSTVKMTWDNDDKANVRLASDGTLSFDARYVSLSSPTFKFYSPTKYVATAKSLKFVGYDVTNSEKTVDKGIVFDMSANANDAVVNINLPGNSVALKRAAIASDGNLVFSGKLKLNLFAASLDMQNLGYGMNNKNEFKVNGVRAKGKLKVPKKPGDDDGPEEDANTSVLGFGGAKLEGDISTFPEDEHYKFEFELKIQNLFSTEASLNLVRLKKNGSLCPNDLSFFLKMENGMGIDITPTTPVVTITGGGGGISDLAKTIDGDYTGIPPVVLTLKTSGTVVKVVEGDLTLDIGPSKLQLTASDIGFKVGSEKLDIIKKLWAGVYVNSKQLRYQNIDFSGLEFGGNLGINVALITKKQAGDSLIKKKFVDCIKADAELKVNTIMGEGAKGGKKYFYGYLGFGGHASCDFFIPVVKKQVLGAKLDFSIGGESYTEMGSVSGVGKFLKNLDIVGGISASANVGKYYGQVIYIIPSKSNSYKGDLALKAGKGSADDIDWNELLHSAGEAVIAAREGVVMLAEPEKVTLEDGEEAVALVVANTENIDSETKVNKKLMNDGSGSVTKQVTVDKNDVPDGEGVILAVVPDNQDDLDAILSSVTTDITGWTAKRLTGDTISAEESDSINVWSGGLDIDEEGNTTKDAVYLDIPKELIPDSGKFNVTADKGFTINAMATSPITELNGNTENNVLHASIANPADGADYTLRTYYGTKGEDGKIKQDYLIDSREIASADSGNVQDIELVKRGDFAPSGKYYVSTMLVDSLNVPVAVYESESEVTFVNDSIPEAPANVTLENIGGERMLGTWTEVADTAKYHIDGYKVAIYQKDENGDYVDTGRGYSFERTDLDSFKAGETTIDGLTYDENTGKYSIDMAMTVGGTDVDGNTAEGQKPLEADEEYKIGVSAYTTKEMEALDDNGETTSTPSFGEESLSNGAVLPVYNPVSFGIYLNDNKLVKNSESSNGNNTETNNIYEYIGNDVSGAKIKVGDFKNKNGVDVSSDNVDVTVTKVGETDDNGEPVTLDVDENGDFIIPDFDGVLQLEVKAGHKHGGVVDETTDYVNIEKDDIPPTITLDQTVTYADENGDYSITGITDAGVEVSYEYNKTVYESHKEMVWSTVTKRDENGNPVVDENGDYVYEDVEREEDVYEKVEKTIQGKVTSSDDGSFTITDALDDNNDAAMLYLTAADDCGNESDTVVAAVSRQVKQLVDPEYTAPAANKLTYNGNKQQLVSGGNVVTGGALQYALGDSEETAPDTDNFTEDIPEAQTAGDYYVWYRLVGDEDHYGVREQCIPVTITGAPVTVKAADTGKTYDDVDPTFTASVTGLIGTDTADMIAYDISREAGESVKEGGYALTPNGNEVQGNYKVTYEPGTFTINKKPVTVSGITAEDKVYDGNTDAKLVYGSASFAGKKADDELTVTAKGEFTDADVGTDKKVTISEYKLSGAGAGNYVLAETGQQTETTANITKASHDDSTVSGQAKYGSEGLVNLEELIVSGGTATYADKTDVDGIIDGTPAVIVQDGKQLLSFRIVDDDSKVGKTATVNVKVTSGNYKDYSITVTLNVINKEAQTLIFDKTTVDAAYGDPAFTNELTGAKTTVTYSVKAQGEGPVAATVNEQTGKVTITGTGSVTITAKAAGSAEYKAAEASYTLNVKPKDVTIKGLSVENKVYDGTIKATVKGTAAIDGLLDDDKDGVSVKEGKAEYADANAGTGKTVSFSGYSLTGNKAGLYNLTAQPPDVKADITAKEVKTPDIQAEYSETVYDGTPKQPAVLSVKDGDTVIPNSEYTVGYADNIWGGTATVKIADKEGGNYTVTGSKTFTIKRVSIKVIATGKEKIYGDADPSLTYSVEGIVSADSGKNVLNGMLIRDEGQNKGTYAINQGTLKLSDDYKDCYDITFVGANFTVNAKNISAAQIILKSDELEYNGNDQSPVIDRVFMDNTILSDTTDYEVTSGDKGKDVDTYTLKVTGKGNYTGEASKAWKIKEASKPTQAPEPTAVPTQAAVSTQAPTAESPQTSPESTTTVPADNTASAKKTIKLLSIKYKKGTKVISGNVSVNKTTVRIKVGSDKYKKAKVTGKKFKLKLSTKLKKKDKITIKISKKKYKTFTKSYKVK